MKTYFQMITGFIVFDNYLFSHVVHVILNPREGWIFIHLTQQMYHQYNKPLNDKLKYIKSKILDMGCQIVISDVNVCKLV